MHQSGDSSPIQTAVNHQQVRAAIVRHVKRTLSKPLFVYLAEKLLKSFC
jgi:hypothetical protein